MAKGGKAKDRTSRAVDCLLRILLMGISDSYAYGAADRVLTRFFFADSTRPPERETNGVPVACRAKVVLKLGMTLPSRSRGLSDLIGRPTHVRSFVPKE